MRYFGSRGGNAPRQRDSRLVSGRQPSRPKRRLPRWLRLLAPPLLVVLSLRGDIKIHGFITFDTAGSFQQENPAKVLQSR
jgi:hypothetical protein